MENVIKERVDPMGPEEARQRAMASIIKRIDNAKSVERLRNLELAIKQTYAAGFLIANELSRLDRALVNRVLKLEKEAI